MAIGVIVNILTVVVGGILGAVAGKGLSREFADKLTLVFGVCAMGMGSVPLFRWRTCRQ